MRREIAIETGVIERLYSIDRGITTLLIEHGIDEALIPHGTTDRPAAEIVAIIRDHEAAIDSVFDFVGSNRQLTTAYIKELHSLLTRHQSVVKAQSSVTGELVNVPLLRGDWKLQPNNPSRDDGTVHEYAPPVHVAAEMDRLIDGYHEQEGLGVPPEIISAWLHHRFTQIHPFQDGNGRVARCLASLVLIKHGWFPLTITNDDRGRYIRSLELADRGSLGELVAFFADREKRAFIHALSASDQALTEFRQSEAILSAVRETLARQHEATTATRAKLLDRISATLLKVVEVRLLRLKTEVRATLAEVRHSNVSVRKALQNTNRVQWHTIPIAAVARALSYYANRRTYAAWAELMINIASDRTEMLFSFHGLGPVDQGVRVVSAIAFKHEIGESGQGQVTQIESLSETPFQYSYLESEFEVERRFTQWLEEMIITGLSYWQRSIQSP